MDLSWLQYLRDGIGLAGLCALLIAVIVLRQQPRSKNEPSSSTLAEAVAPNGNNGTNGKVSKDYIEARIYQHEVNCSRAEEILKRLDRMENKLDKVLGGGR
jgi:hypothetical protein